MQIKSLAWEFLLKNDIEDFQQNVESAIALVKRKGWRIYSYKEHPELLKEFDVEQYASERNGFTYVYHNGEFIIFYRDELPYNEKIFVIMHEIGHIEAHHTYAGCILGQGNTIWETDSQEQEANIFACECLAPSCILSSLGVDTVEKLKRLELLPDRYNSLQIAEMHREEGEQKCGLCREIRKKYQEYIRKFKRERIKEQSIRLMRSPVPYIAVILVMALIFWIPDAVIKTGIVPASEQVQALQKTVYVTKTGTKYHRINCGHLKNTDLALTVEQALANGYTPCGVCNPPDGQD